MSNKIKTKKRSEVRGQRSETKNPKQIFFVLGIILATTLFAFFPAIHNDFTNWDDTGYVTENKLIKDLSLSNLKNFFTQNVEGNFHPLTMLSLALDYHFFELNPLPYHIVNILLHLLNTVLVFFFILNLLNHQGFKNLDGFFESRLLVPTITAILFGIHPMHTESVAWVAERKDVLYSFFFLFSLIFYMKWSGGEGQTKKIFTLNYSLSILFFILSLLSKSMAVPLPLVLILIDYYKKPHLTSPMGRKFGWLNNFLPIGEVRWGLYLPFLLLSLVFGVVTIIYQKQTSSIQSSDLFAFYERIFFAGYGLLQYIFKLIIPFKLSCFYPYPVKENGVFFPVEFYIPLFVILLSVFIIYKKFRHNKDIVFGSLFFLITISLVLQILAVGSTIMADRYSYIPYIGIFFIIGKGVVYFSENNKKIKPVLLGILSVYIITLTLVTRSRCGVWKDSFVLWEDVISKYPMVQAAYNNTANAYKKLQKNELALEYYNKLIAIDPNFKGAYNDRANVHLAMKNYEMAMKDANTELEKQPNLADAINTRGSVYFETGKFDAAITDFNAAIIANPTLSGCYNNRANAYSMLGKYDLALADYNVLLTMEPEKTQAYIWRGIALQKTGKTEKAIKDFDYAISISATAFPDAYYNRSIAYFEKKKYQQALVDVEKTKQLGMRVDENYVQNLKNIVKQK